MRNCGATFDVNVNQQPVLPFADLLSQKKTQKVALLPIGAKIKSFKISSNAQALNQTIKIKLPNFVDLQSYSLHVDAQQLVTKSLDLPIESHCNLRTIQRFWWHWLLSSKS